MARRKALTKEEGVAQADTKALFERVKNGCAFLFGLEEQGMMKTPEYNRYFWAWSDLLDEYMATGDGLYSIQQQGLTLT